MRIISPKPVATNEFTGRAGRVRFPPPPLCFTDMVGILCFIFYCLGSLHFQYSFTQLLTRQQLNRIRCIRNRSKEITVCPMRNSNTSVVDSFSPAVFQNVVFREGETFKFQYFHAAF